MMAGPEYSDDWKNKWKNNIPKTVTLDDPVVDKLHEEALERLADQVTKQRDQEILDSLTSAGASMPYSDSDTVTSSKPLTYEDLRQMHVMMSTPTGVTDSLHAKMMFGTTSGHKGNLGGRPDTIIFDDIEDDEKTDYTFDDIDDLVNKI